MNELFWGMISAAFYVAFRYLSYLMIPDLPRGQDDADAHTERICYHHGGYCDKQTFPDCSPWYGDDLGD